MKLYVFVFLCFVVDFIQLIISIEIRHSRDPKLLFGGYRITPRFCKPTKKILNDTGGPNICMFNHECIQRQGELVGACMDGFLFGACCHLPYGTAGELIQNATKNSQKIDNVESPHAKPMIEQSSPPVDITSNGIHHITQTLLNSNVLQTIDNNAIVQINGNENEFSTTGILHHFTPDTSIENTEGVFTPSGYVTKKPTTESRKTTSGTEHSTLAYDHGNPLLTVSVSSPSYTSRPITTTFIRPMFHQKPSDTNKYVLVPTITKPSDQSGEKYPVIHLLESDTTTKAPSYSSSSNKPLSTSYIYDSGTTVYKPYTSKKPPSTSYVFSSTIPPRRTTSSQTTTTKLKPSTTKNKTSKPSKTSNKKTKKPPQTKPSQSTAPYTPNVYQTTKKPPSTSYVYSSQPTRRPGSTVGIEGPGLSVSADPIPPYSNSVGYPSPAPTLIVLGPVTDDSLSHSSPSYSPSAYPASTYQTTGTKPPRKPINHVTINNHVTQNIFPGTRPPNISPSSLGYVGSSERPSPTVLITPKPSIISSSARPTLSDEYITASINVEPSVDQLVNFPPVRNPNLNMSQYGENDVTTPAFIEDEFLNDKMESFVNKIVQGLQEPFQDLDDIVYNRNKTKPIKKQGVTTKKPVTKPSRPTGTSRPSRPTSVRPASVRPSPVRPSAYTRPSSSYPKPSSARPSVRPGTSSTRPSGRPTSSRPTPVRTQTTVRITTRRPTRRPSNPSSAATTKRTAAPSKKPSKVTRRPTTTESLIEKETLSPAIFTDDYRRECGRRPLVKTGRIVGGREAKFGEWPWQVLVRESTWLGLFTKNKCGGVLISNRYVLTAAHCQPGFLASLVAVFGEFDISGERETKRAISRNVKRVIVNRGYDPQTFENDLALLELESPIPFDQHIIPICLPRDNEDFTGRLATVTGWGRLKYNGGVPSVLQEVQVPIMENSVCQEMFRTAAHSKIILDSFLCAGYANGQKDSCEGDSGGPLVLQRSDGRYQLAGTVSHGVKCASPYLPGVYMRTQWFKPWIVSITGIN